MKKTCLPILLLCFCFNFAFTQQQTERNIWARAYKKDSVFFTTDYLLTEDTCADIIRIGAFDPWTKKFTGPYKDVSKADPATVVAEGRYTDAGLKDGAFISHYLNGALAAKGTFKNNNYFGQWEIYYADGKPKLFFTATDSLIKIKSVWNEAGKQVVTSGAGNYEAEIGPISWSGKLVGGLPDGRWTAKRNMFKTDEVLATEKFKLGTFLKGSTALGEYNDSSHIILVSPELLIQSRTEKLFMTTTPCHAAAQRIIYNAQPPGGSQQLIENIAERLLPVLGKNQPLILSEPIQLNGKVLEDGRLLFSNDNNNRQLVAELAAALNGLPNFVPAKVNGRAVSQKIVITINLNSSVYVYNWRLLPVED